MFFYDREREREGKTTNGIKGRSTDKEELEEENTFNIHCCVSH